MSKQIDINLIDYSSYIKLQAQYKAKLNQSLFDFVIVCIVSGYILYTNDIIQNLIKFLLVYYFVNLIGNQLMSYFYTKKCNTIAVELDKSIIEMLKKETSKEEQKEDKNV